MPWVPVGWVVIGPDGRHQLITSAAGETHAAQRAAEAHGLYQLVFMLVPDPPGEDTHAGSGPRADCD